MADFKVLTTFPRRDVSFIKFKKILTKIFHTQLMSEDPTKTLKELNLYPQETLILEAKNDN